MRGLETARTELRRAPSGQVELTIEHAPLPGIDRSMLAWWFQSFDRPCTFRGKDYAQAYLLWHPFDHHSVTVSRNGQGRVAPGETVHIREAMNADLAHAVDQVVTIHRWDEGGIGFHASMAGRRAFSLDHVFEEQDGAVAYRSRMRLGHEAGLLRPVVNAIARRRFGDETRRRWFAHNIEEVGCLPQFLPELYAAR